MSNCVLVATLLWLSAYHKCLYKKKFSSAFKFLFKLTRKNRVNKGEAITTV